MKDEEKGRVAFMGDFKSAPRAAIRCSKPIGGSVPLSGHSPFINLSPPHALLTPQIARNTAARTDVIPTQHRRDTDIEFALFPNKTYHSLTPGPRAPPTVARTVGAHGRAT